MGDRAAEGALGLAPLDVHMDPLVIAGDVGECVDHVLADFELGSELAELFGGESVDGVDVVERDGGHDGSPWPAVPLTAGA